MWCKYAPKICACNCVTDLYGLAFWYILFLFLVFPHRFCTAPHVDQFCVKVQTNDSKELGGRAEFGLKKDKHAGNQ